MSAENCKRCGKPQKLIGPRCECGEPDGRAHCAVSTGSALPEWMNTPEKRRDIWAWQALVAAFVGDEEKAEECAARAEVENKKCASPRVQNTSVQPRRRRRL
jgi:hypothetical protein